MPGKNKANRGRSQGPRARNGQENHHPNRTKHGNNSDRNNSDNTSVANIARTLAAQIQKASEIGSAVSRIIPQKGEALEVVQEKYLLSMSMLTEEYKQKTALDEKIADMQVDEVNQALKGQKIAGLDPQISAALDSAIVDVRQLHTKYKMHLTAVDKMAETVCACPNEQANGQDCKISSTLSITKQFDSLTQKRGELRIEFNKALNEIKKKSPFGVAVPDYDYYKKLVMHTTDPTRNRHPDKHHVTNHVQSLLGGNPLRKALADMRLSDVRSDQALSASLRYL